MAAKRDRSAKAVKDRARRELYAGRGICVSCGQADAEPGRRYCPSCARKALARVKKWDPDGSKRRVNAKALREARKAKGLCINCGKPADGIHIRCPGCQRKHRESNQVYEIRKRVKREAEKEKGWKCD